jgi:sRNA-binding protein
VGFSLKGNGKTCNSSAFGTSVRLKKGGAAQLKYILASNGLGAQSDSRVLFALDEGIERVEIEVSWCGRWMESHTSYVRKYHAITQK